MHSLERRWFFVTTLLWSIALVGMFGFAITLHLNFHFAYTFSTLMVGSIAVISGFVFLLTSLRFVNTDDECSVIWEAFSQAVVVLTQALRARTPERGYEYHRRALGILSTVSPKVHCPPLQKALEKLTMESRRTGEKDWQLDANYCLGVFQSINPFAIPPVRFMILVQAFWQITAIMLGMTIALVVWQDVENHSLRSLFYSASSGMLGASLYNLRTLADHIAVQRDYSSRFWLDYLTRPLIGSVLGVVVYAFLIGLTWTITFQITVNAQIPKVAFSLGFLCGYALRSVLTWLNGIAKTIFRPAPSPSEQEERQQITVEG